MKIKFSSQDEGYICFVLSSKELCLEKSLIIFLLCISLNDLSKYLIANFKNISSIYLNSVCGAFKNFFLTGTL